MTETGKNLPGPSEDTRQVVRNTKLIALWDMHSHRSWAVDGSRHGTNVALINGFVAQAVNLSRAVLVLHQAQMDFQAVPLIRATLECAVVSCWLALYPEKTPALVYAHSKKRKTLLTSLIKEGFDGEPGLAETLETMDRLEPDSDPVGGSLEQQCNALLNGSQIYMMYRTLSAYSHPGNALADEYIDDTPPQDSYWGFTMLNAPKYNDGVGMLGINAALLLRAQIAADHVLVKPRHSTQLRQMAKQMGVSPTIERAPGR